MAWNFSGASMRLSVMNAQAASAFEFTFQELAGAGAQNNDH
jgi:hypothetical protein